MDHMFRSMNEKADKLLLAQSSQKNVFVRRSKFQDQQSGYQQMQMGTPHGFIPQQSQAPQFQEPDMPYMQSGYDPYAGQSGYDPYAGHIGDDLQNGSWEWSDGFPQQTPYAQQVYYPPNFSTPEPYAGYIGDDLEHGSWEWSDGFPEQPTSAQQVYYPPDFSTPGPSHAHPPHEDPELIGNILKQLLQEQADMSLMLDRQKDRLTNIEAWGSPQENTNSSFSTSTQEGTLPMHQDMDPTESYNEWSVVDNTTQAEQEYAYDAIEYALELESDHLFLDFALASTSPAVQHTTLNVDIDEISEGDELKSSEMLVDNKENERAIEEHSQLPYGPSVERLETEKTFQDGKLNDKKEEASKSVEKEEQHTTLNMDIDELSEGDEQKLSEMRVINKKKREPLFEKLEYPHVPLPHEPNFTFTGVISAKDISLEDPMKPPFEEIRMKKFKGWFYDEYDPGDPNLQ